MSLKQAICGVIRTLKPLGLWGLPAILLAGMLIVFANAALVSMLPAKAASTDQGLRVTPNARQNSSRQNSRLHAGGRGTYAYHRIQPLTEPASNLPNSEKPDFYAGRALARQPWVRAPATTTARDGLGPLYNARSCLACHIRGGRGEIPEMNLSNTGKLKRDQKKQHSDDRVSVPSGPISKPLFSALVKLNRPGDNSVLGTIADPIYGDQLQPQSIALHNKFVANAGQEENPLPGEATVTVAWVTKVFQYADGRKVNLRRPIIEIQALGYGPLHDDTNLSLRNSPVLYGAGLLEAVAQNQILLWADPDDENADGISGRANWVTNFRTKKIELGRFGWKANRADVENITAAAFANDIGIRNPLFPQSVCTPKQKLCAEWDNGAHPGLEISDSLLQLTANFIRNIAVPQAAPLTDRGRVGQALFNQLDCNGCHRPNLLTATDASPSHLAGQTIWPYSDLLLHDMGPGLADGRSEYVAQEQEWRTPPLWGISRDTKVKQGQGYLLHDGRARTIEEAILWHGGEAAQSRRKFSSLNMQQREDLIKFVLSL